MLARFSEMMSFALVCNNLPPITSFLLTLELSQYHKSGCKFSSSWPVAGSSDCRRLGKLRHPVLVLARPTRQVEPAPSCAGAQPQKLGH